MLLLERKASCDGSRCQEQALLKVALSGQERAQSQGVLNKLLRPLASEQRRPRPALRVGGALPRPVTHRRAGGVPEPCEGGREEGTFQHAFHFCGSKGRTEDPRTHTHRPGPGCAELCLLLSWSPHTAAPRTG